MSSKSLNLGKLATKDDGKKKKDEYPVVPGTPVLVELVDQFIEIEAIAKAYDGAAKALKDQIKDAAVRPFYLANKGTSTPVSSVVADGSRGNQVMVSFTSKYSAGKPELLESILPENLIEANFETVLGAKFNCKGLSLEKQQAIAKALNGLAEWLELPAGVVELSTAYAPNENFHTRRHTVLTLEQNLTLAASYACVTSVKVRSAQAVNSEKIATEVASLKKLETLAESAKPEKASA